MLQYVHMQAKGKVILSCLSINKMCKFVLFVLFVLWLFFNSYTKLLL